MSIHEEEGGITVEVMLLWSITFRELCIKQLEGREIA